MAYHQLRIARIVQETPDARSFVFDVPANLADKFRKEGYDDLPLDELQDRLSKMSGPLAAIILKGRV